MSPDSSPVPGDVHPAVDSETLEVLAQGLRAGIGALQDPEATDVDLAALLEVYARVAAWSEEDLRAAGLRDLFRAASRAWVAGGAEARDRVFEGLALEVVVDSGYELSDEDTPDEEDVLRWAAAVVRIGLLVRMLEPEEREQAFEAIAECRSVADTHPSAFLPAAMLSAILRETEPVDRWPPEAIDLVELFSRLPLLALVDGDL